MEILKDNRNIKELETLQKKVNDDRLPISDENQIVFKIFNILERCQ